MGTVNCFAARHMRAAFFALLIELASVSAFAEVHTYECNSVPTDAEWRVGLNWCDPQEWAADGSFYQYVDFCPGFDPPQGKQSSYAYSLANFIGTEDFWFEFVVVSDGDSSELISVAPVSILFGNNSVLYQFIISDDQVRFIRDLALGELYFDIEPGVHTYRVEVFGDKLFTVWVDGEVVDAGLPELNPYPLLAPESQVWFRTKAKFFESTSTWSYIRWGHLQAPGSGDFTDDGQVTIDDFQFFHECLSTPAGSWPGCAWADANFDGQVNCADWDLFLAAWTDGTNPPSVPQCDCPTDLSADGTINASDLAILLGAWGSNPGHAADFSNDALVNATDLALLLGTWGACQ